MERKNRDHGEAACWDGTGDEVAFWCASLALGCGTVATASAALGCWNQVLSFFSPKLGWLLLAPSLFTVLLGTVGLSASRKPASTLLRLQLAVFILIVAVVLAGTGIFTYVSSSATAQWISDGCDDHRATGLWDQARRIKTQMKTANSQYAELRCGWERCRGLDPLVYDLAVCGIRAKCREDGPRSGDLPMHDWFQHVQLTYACGGFCTDEVPLFGLSTMRETLTKRPSCAMKMSDSVRSFGQVLGGVASLVSLPLIIGALVLFCAAAAAGDEDLQDYGDSDLEYEDASHLMRGSGSGGGWQEEGEAEPAE